MGNVANECIPRYEPGQRITAKTTADVVGCRVVAISGGLSSEGNIQVAHAVANLVGDFVGAGIGVASHDAASGTLVTIIGPGAVVPVDITADVTAGDKLMQGAAGKVTKAASTAQIIGHALTSADFSDGDQVFMRIVG